MGRERWAVRWAEMGSKMEEMGRERKRCAVRWAEGDGQ